jgi:hypothetical protein
MPWKPAPPTTYEYRYDEPHMTVGDKHRGAEVSYGTLSVFGPTSFWQTEGCTTREYPILRLRFFFGDQQPDWVLVEGYDPRDRSGKMRTVLAMIENTLRIDTKGTV